MGPLDLNFESLDLPTEPGLQLNLYTASPGGPTAHALALLASWATQDTAARMQPQFDPHRRRARE